MGCRIRGGGDIALGEMDIARRNQNLSQEVSHQCEQQLGRIPPAGDDRQLSGGRLEAASVPVDDVHQAGIT